MRRTILILAVLCAGCNSAASQTGDATDDAAHFAARERQLLDMCDEIAVEREILAAKYNALIEAHNLDMRPVQLTVKRCI